jgi:hypothetical protein
MRKKSVFLLIACLAITSVAFADVYTFRSPETESDHRYDYDNAILKLALEKTIEEFGGYKLEPSPNVNFARARSMVKQKLLKNFMFKQSYSDELAEDMAYVPFPIDLGITGYRVFFISSKIKDKLSAVNSLEELKKFSIVQGIGWRDIDILEYHGFTVKVVGSYESMFKMVARNRADLFSRGSNELLGEYESHKDIPFFDYDRKILLAYPLPRFFFTHRDNIEAIKRVNKGLTIAFEDGSLQKLWGRHYRDSINFVKLHERKMFRITNPMIKNLDNDYQKYFYDPFQ